MFVLKHEGGYVNDPKDPGGETKWGISKRAYPNLDIKNLSAEDATRIYSRDYWDVCNCDNLDYPLCTVVFDSGVVDGPVRAIQWLKASKDIAGYLLLRKLYYANLVKKNPAEQRFLAGWLNRVGDLQKLVEIASNEVPEVDVTQLPEWHY